MMKTIMIALCVAVLLAGGLLAGSNTLVSFAIGRNVETKETDVVPESTLSEDMKSIIADNWSLEAERAAKWVEASRVEKAEILSADGLRLRGEAVITDPASHLWVIAVHGYRSSHSFMAVLAAHYGDRGYNALLPDLRACGESEGEYIGMGWLDRKDILLWIDWILQRDSEAQIVLHGISMGGATVMMTAGEPLPAQVKAVVEDCGYTSVWDIFEDEMGVLFHLPGFPLLNIGSWISAFRAGYGFSEASSVKQLEKASVPVLFIHGAEDNFVRTEMVYRVYEACPSEKQLLVVEGAGHGTSFARDPDLYFETVFGFLENYITE